MKVSFTFFVFFFIIGSIFAYHNHNKNEYDSNESEDSHDSHNSHDSNESEDSHDSHNSHDSNESEDSHNSHDSDDSHDDHHSHGSHESHEDENYKPSAKCLYGQISAEKCCALFPKDLKVSLQHPLNCNQYFKCQKGRPELKNCPKGLHWSVKKQKCLKPQDAKCLINWKPTTTESPKFPKGCFDGLISAKYCCSLSSSWFKYLPDPENCHMFYKCVSGHPVHISCPHGLNWSIKYRKCVYRQFADCYSSSTISTTANYLTTLTESTIEITSNIPGFSSTEKSITTTLEPIPDFTDTSTITSVSSIISTTVQTTVEISNTFPHLSTIETNSTFTEPSFSDYNSTVTTVSDYNLNTTSELTTERITTTEDLTTFTESYTDNQSDSMETTILVTENTTDQTFGITNLTISWPPTYPNSKTTTNAVEVTTSSSGNEGPCSLVSLDCRHGRISADECCKGVPYWQEALLQNNDNCATYFQCVHEKPVIKECPGGLKWNADVCRCEWPSISTCNL